MPHRKDKPDVSYGVLPGRKIVPSSRGVRGFIPSLKSGESIGYESTLERDLYVLLEFDSDVLTYREQPGLELTYRSARGRRAEYTPDVLISYRSGATVVGEVKYRRDLFANWGKFHVPLRAAWRYAAERGWTVKIFSEVEIRTSRLRNCMFLMRYRSIHVEPSDAWHMLDVLGDGPLSVGALLPRLTSSKLGQAQWLGVIWALVAQDVVNASFEEPFSLSTSLAPP